MIVVMDDMLTLTKHLPMVEYAAGDVIISEGGDSSGVWILISGSLRVTKNGEEVNTVSLPGSLIGEMSILLGIPDSATVAAREHSVMRYAEDGEALLTRCRAEGHVPNELMARYYVQRASAGLIVPTGFDAAVERPAPQECKTHP